MHQVDQLVDQMIDQEVSQVFSIVHQRQGHLKYKCVKGDTNGFPDDQLRPIEETTLFEIASVSKIFTGALMVKLAESGQISLLDKVQRYLPDMPFDDVQIHHLMTHTAGYDSFEPITGPADERDFPAYIQRIYAVQKRLFAVGEQFAYFTHGYALLKVIIEQITGTTLEKFAREVLLDPLKMVNSTFDKLSRPPEQVAVPIGPTGKPMQQVRVEPQIGDRGLYSRADELVHFGEMILAGGVYKGKQVFSEASVALMLRECTGGKLHVTPNLWINSRYGASNGCFGDLHSPSAVGHTGYSGCMLSIDPELQTTTAIVTNSCRLHEDWNNYGRIHNALLA